MNDADNEQETCSTERCREEMGMMDDQNLEKESGQLLTDEELLEIDNVLFQTGGDIMKKSNEIAQILNNLDHSLRRLRREYLSVRAGLKDKKKAFMEEKKEKEELERSIDLLAKKYEVLKEKYAELKSKLENANREKDKMSGRLQELENQLSEQEKESGAREAGFEQFRKDYRQFYDDAKSQKEKAQADFEQCRELCKSLQERLNRESEKKEANEREAEELKKQLQAQNDEFRSLDEKVRQYERQRENMPFLIRLSDACDSIVEKRDELPREFFDCLQNVVPLDDFERFLSGALDPSFPVYYHDAVQSFLAACRRRGEVSDETVKHVLGMLDALLSAVLDFADKYFEKERFFRISVGEGDRFDQQLCRYIGADGGIYGKIVKVWLHGFRDGKENKVYCSYVEGE